MTYQAIRTNEAHKTLWVLMLFAYLLLPLGSVAQINISGKVFGGARQADVQGHTFVQIGAEKHDVIIDAVYGGNDIAGTIGSSPLPGDEHINGSYSSFVRTVKEATGKHLFIGQLFGGGYGQYTYTPDGNKFKTEITYKVWDANENEGNGAFVDKPVQLTDIVKPELAKAYVDIHGGTIAYVYGGGDNVTVTERTDICIDNASDVTTKITDVTNADVNTNNLLNAARLVDMGIPAIQDVINSDTYQISRVFGGNNKADMAIRPMWHLQQGKIENLYSGGNEGRMTSPVGLLLEIKPTVSDNLLIDNVYGGCRKADVRPLNPENGQDMGTSQIQLPDLDEDGNLKYAFPAGLAARVLVYGGNINNVYGGNDITGRVYGGNAVGVYHSIRGNIYGGGNGSYPYTDNVALKNTLQYGDYYYGDFMTANN